MKKKLLLAGICVFLITFIMSAVAHQVNAEEVTITGVVAAMAWDERQNVITVSIDADDGLYYVTHNAIGKQLLALVDREVKVTGILGEDTESNIIITVKSYEVLDN